MRVLFMVLALAAAPLAIASGHDGYQYKECGLQYGFPRTVLNEFDPPEKLTLEQKGKLVKCADKVQSPGFSKWVTRELRGDIKKGLVPAPGAIAPRPKEERAESSAESRVPPTGFLGLIAAILPFFAIAILFGAFRLQTKGHDVSWGPVLLVVGAMFLISFGTWGLGSGGRQHHFDEMDGLYPVVFAAVGLFIAVIVAIVIVIKARRDMRDEG